MADALRIMEGMNISINTVRLSGGGARSSFWRQLQADIYNKTVATINSQEGPAYGVAILAGVGTGIWKDVPEACKAAIRQTETLRPDRNTAKMYGERHVQYQRLYAALKPEFDLMAKA